MVSGAGDDKKLKVFISYSRKDLIFAQRIVAALEARGLAPKIDTRDLPDLEDWRRELLRFIRETDAVVFIVSQHSISSPICSWEVEQVARLNKRLAPIVLERVPDDRIPEAIAKINYLFFDRPDDFEPQADKLAWALQSDLVWLKEHTRLGELARRWDERKRAASSMLRGQELQDAERWIVSRPWGAPAATELHRELIAQSRLAATRRQRLMLAGSIATAVIGFSLAGLAYWQRGIAVEQRRLAEEQTRIAQSREIAARANAVLETDPQAALHFAIRGVLRWRTTEAETALRRVLTSVKSGAIESSGHIGGPEERVVTVSRTGKYGVTQHRDGGLTIWQLQPEIRRVRPADALLGTPMFSHDETLIAALAPEGVLTVATTEQGQPVFRLDKIQTARFSAKGLTYLRVDSPDFGSVMLWDTSSREAVPVGFLKTPQNARGALSIPGPDNTYLVFDDRNIEVWNAVFFSPLRGQPMAKNTDEHGIANAWFSENGSLIITTNANGSTVLQTTTTRVVSILPFRSLRTVAFGESEFMVVVPESGPPAVVSWWTGQTLATLPQQGRDIAAAAFEAGGQSITLVSLDGSIWHQPCVACMTLDQALETAKSSLTRPLTLQERELYLHEKLRAFCESYSFPAPDCVELAPNSGAPGSVVEYRLRLSPMTSTGISFIDSAGRNFIPSIDGAPVDTSVFRSVQPTGTLTIPKGAALGAAKVQAGPAERSFLVICDWCDP